MRKIRVICGAIALVVLFFAVTAAQGMGAGGGLVTVAPLALGAIVMVFACFTDLYSPEGRRRTLQGLLVFAGASAVSGLLCLLNPLAAGFVAVPWLSLVALVALYPATLRASRRRRLGRWEGYYGD